MNLFKYINTSRIKVIIISLILLSLTLFIYIDIFNKNINSNSFLKYSIDKFSKTVGLSIKNIQVSGLINTDTKSIENITKFIYGKATIFTDINNIKENLERVEWVDVVEVKKIYPDKLYIKVREKTPFAIWQNKNELSLISNEGVFITNKNLNFYKNFPLVIGPDAPIHAEKLVQLINTDVEIYKRVTAATRVGMRRWNILIDGRINILLPEHNFQNAWRELIRLQKTKNILDRKVLIIDFRDKDRLIIRLMPGVIDEINQSEEMT